VSYGLSETAAAGAARLSFTGRDCDLPFVPPSGTPTSKGDILSVSSSSEASIVDGSLERAALEAVDAGKTDGHADTNIAEVDEEDADDDVPLPAENAATGS